nr:MAG TPA: hypothetical protein [Caudoviricetes sp.]
MLNRPLFRAFFPISQGRHWAAFLLPVIKQVTNEIFL